MASRTAPLNPAGDLRARRRRRAVRFFALAWAVAAAAALLWTASNRGGSSGPPAASTRAMAPAAMRPDPASSTVPGEAAPDPLLEALLREGDYEAVVELYADTYTDGHAATAHQYREAILRQVSDHIQGGEYDHATALLDTYLAVFYRDTEALVYAGRAYRENGRYRAAIEAFLRAAQQDQHPDKLRMVHGQLSWTINLYAQALRERDARQELVELYAYLTHADPRNPHYFVELARAYAAVGRTDDALAALQFVAAEGDAGRDALELIEQIRAER